MRKIKQLYDTYNFPGFRAEHKIAGIFGDPYAVVLRLRRRGKNDLRSLRTCASDVLRSQGSSGARSFLRGSACLAGGGDSPSLVPKGREGEGGGVGMAGRQILF